MLMFNKKKASKKSFDDIRDYRRRKFLKWSAFGGVTLLFGRLFGKEVNEFIQKENLKGEVLNKMNFKNFQMVETEERLSLYDKNRNSVLSIDKE